MVSYFYDRDIDWFLKGKRRGVSWQKIQPLNIRFDLMQKVHPGSLLSFEQQRALNNTLLFDAGASEHHLTAPPGASEGRLNKRKFLFELSTELLVYGRTEPDAAVWLNGKKITLNPDGSFTLRYSLVDGEIPFRFIAQSFDQMEQRHIYTGVQRERTISFPKMLRDPNG